MGTEIKSRDEWYKDKAEEWMEDNDVDFKNGRFMAKNPEMSIRDADDDWDGDDL